MAQKSSVKPKQNDPEQSKRFIETARELGAEESPESFEHAFKKVVGNKSKTLKASRPTKAGNS
jgi:hypothetical protein